MKNAHFFAENWQKSLKIIITKSVLEMLKTDLSFYRL
jgi:hypothetical protein